MSCFDNYLKYARFAFCVFAMTIFINCNNNKIKNDVELILSQDLIVNYSDMDTVKIGSLCHNKKSSLRIISYIDSLNCTSCSFEHIYMWEDLIDKMRDCKGNLSVEFIFSNANNIRNDEWEELTKFIPDISIFIDSSNSFIKRNPQIKSNPMLHTFLVDSTNKVLLVGNPIKNKNVEMLLEKTIKEKFNK